MKNIGYLLLLVVLLASCRSTKKATEVTSDVTAPVDTIEQKTEETKTVQKKDSKAEKKKTDVWKWGENFTAKVKVAVKIGEKDVSTSGTLKMRKNDVVQVILVDPYLGVMEVGRLEITPDAVLVIDRVNKRYMQESYEKISSIAGTEITFTMVQNLFWSEANDKSKAGNVSFTFPLKTPVVLNLKLSNIGNDSDWNGHTKVSSKYAKVNIEEIFKGFAEQK